MEDGNIDRMHIKDRQRKLLPIPGSRVDKSKVPGRIKGLTGW